MANDPAAPAAKKPTTAPAKTPAASAAPSAPAAPSAAAPVDPAAAAIRDVARDAEIRRLTDERDELRKRVGDTSELETLRAEVAALREAAARTGGVTPRWTMSAGVAADLENTGYATDPTTGDAYVRDGDKVTVTSRGGRTRTVDMPRPSGAGDSDSARKN
ncbi:hypothetical protein [Micromonospora sp. NPDC047730]|uniref:hypothetical protein n=1 Tax=Micromonospora sp. NPDC047730 TaxID=3364253 RepID=UPI003716BB9A